ncbi:hypothetical protein SAMN05444267_104813 [Chryseobacterium polytrichastri]|uniref:Uncharacterized protein n=1 Tax=Chryseobacterium polytrichastri TaxID=1302687 RepID=A0A1M7ITP8_9FLAO|nr:hypothetical protein SAMN05444267_104813 [Chryseobacterium polytrichastri]
MYAFYIFAKNVFAANSTEQSLAQYFFHDLVEYLF